MTEYAATKDSGIEWIGRIPINWRTERGKNILTLLNRPVEEDDEIITCFRDGEVTLRKNRRELGFTNSLKEIGYQGINVGDLVVHGMDGFAGAIGISDSRGKATPVLNVLESPQNKKYLMYYLRALAFKDVFMSLATGIRVRSCDLRWNKLAVLPFILPSIEEQAAIVSYLDEQCAKIDTLILDAKNSIDEYKNWKASLIFETVTKGLDSTVALKNSGVKWIGKTPQNWNVAKLFLCFNDIGSGTTPKSDIDNYYIGDIHWLQSGDINGGYVTDTSKCVSDSAIKNCSALRIYSAPYIAIAMYGASIANTSIVTVDSCTNQACCVLSNPKPNIDYNFIFYCIHAAKDELLLSARGGTQPNISQDIIKKLRLPIPSLEEQRQIANWLKTKCTHIDQIISQKQSIIAELEEYKKSLIYEVVTGKRKVV